jgi:hypothetical protein
MARFTAHLSSFPFDPDQQRQLVHTSSSGHLSQINHPHTNETLFLMTQNFAPASLTADVCRFLRVVAPPLSTGSPIFLRPLDGWNVRYRHPNFIQLYFVAKYVRPITDFVLSPTEKQIIFYGLARGFSALHKHNLSHTDLRFTDVYLDDRRYPVILRTGEVSQPFSGLTLQTLSPTDVIHLAPARVDAGPNAQTRDIIACADEWSLAMIAYRLLEERPIEIAMHAGESCFTALKNGVRPFLGPKTEKWGSLLTELWKNGPTPYGFDQIVQFLENPLNWLDGVDSVAFWRYKAFVDYEELNWGPKRLSDVSVSKLFRRNSAVTNMKLGKTAIEQFARFLEWLNGSELGKTDPQSYEPILKSLQEKGSLCDVIEPCPSPRTFFRTGGGRLVKTLVGNNTDVSEIIRYLRQVILGSLGHPALL